jgi:histidine triad (HIT) family protein
MSCLFCDIIAGRIASRKAYEDASVLAFHDINPQAPNHLLVIPKKHIASPLDLKADDDALVGTVVRRGVELAREHGLAERGFRLVFNCGEDAGYSVYHLHMHLVGGRRLGWPPG